MRPVVWRPAIRRHRRVEFAPPPFDNTIGSKGVSDADNSLPPSGQTLSQALKSLVATFDAESIRYAIIGGIATIQHTRVRTTNDVDALLSVAQIAMPAMFDALQEGGFTVDLQKNLREFRDDGLTSIRYGEVLVDLLRPVLPVFSHVIDGAVQTDINGQQVRISTAEGLIVMKLIAFRPQDESDIRDLLAAYRGRLDLNSVRSDFQTVAEANDARWVKFESWVSELWNEQK
jgi:predicted nucleotidyltransferase